MHMSLPFCQMSYISVCCGYICSCTDPVLPTVDIHMLPDIPHSLYICIPKYLYSKGTYWPKIMPPLKSTNILPPARCLERVCTIQC